MTPKMGELLRYIRDYHVGSDGVMPTYEEMAKAVGLKSKSGITRLLDELQERGFVRRTHNVARSIVLVEQGIVVNPELSAVVRGYADDVRAKPEDIVTSALREYFEKRKGS